MATAPQPGASRRAAAALDDIAITVVVDDVAHVFRPGEMSALDASALRKEAGMSLRSLLSQINDDPDLDVVAAIVWLARRQAGNPASFTEVAEAISYQSTISAGDDAPAVEEDPDSPEA